MVEKINRVLVGNVSKEFNLENRLPQGVLSRFLSFLSREKQEKRILALDQVSFSVRAGENVGIIGKNAAGKSTLLRTIAGIYSLDSGKIQTTGHLVYLTGFGSGLRRGLTMRENIFLLGSIMGLGQRDIKKRFREIVEFAGLSDFVDLPVKKFSDGMIGRLNFSVGIHCLEHSKPDILLLDETFIGGDIEFKDKFIAKLEEFLLGGASVLFVSHDLERIKKYCSRTILMDRGRIIMDGPSKEVIKEYERIVK